MASSTSKRTDLGFVNDDVDQRLLESRYFPSKIGGKPAWLSLKPIPSTDQLLCTKCSSPLAFLLQVYSPRDRPQEDAFHRTLFVFVCVKPGCNSPNDSSSFVVFRSQLPRVNQFFSAEPPPDDPSEDGAGNPTASKYQPLCVVCGCMGSKKCSRCHSVNYCGKDHQTRHWKAGHKKSCGKQESEGSEFELEIEEEDYSPEDKSMKDDAAAMQEYEQLAANQAETTADLLYSEQDLEGMAAKESEDDRLFRKFQKRVAANKEQVLRYSKGGEPLWVSTQHQPTLEDIPTCVCGAPRQFEFQVMPQLLNYLDVDEKDGNSLDWGTLCVYTCRDSCSISNSYAAEFLWKQDFAADR